MTSSGGGPFDFHNIQEIEDIELKCLNLFASFFIFILFFILSTNDQKRGNQ